MDELIERALRDEASAADLARLSAWRAADAANERHFRQLERLLTDVRALAGESLRGASSPPSAATLLASASLAGAPRSGRWTRRLPWAVAAVALLALVVNLARPPATPAPPQWAPSVIVTGVGEIATVQLGDGSAVRLAPSSRLVLGENGDARSVELDGRAFFSVARAEGRAFRVRTRGGTATVLGTRFEITTEQDDLRLVVVDGRVALETEVNRVEVGAGEEAAISNRVATAPTLAADLHGALQWTGRFLAFQNTPLRHAAQEIERAYGVQVMVTDSTLAARTVTAVFTGRNLDAVLDVVCSVVNAHCVVRGSEVTMSLR